LHAGWLRGELILRTDDQLAVYLLCSCLKRGRNRIRHGVPTIHLAIESGLAVLDLYLDILRQMVRQLLLDALTQLSIFHASILSLDVQAIVHLLNAGNLLGDLLGLLALVLVRYGSEEDHFIADGQEHNLPLLAQTFLAEPVSNLAFQLLVSLLLRSLLWLLCLCSILLLALLPLLLLPICCALLAPIAVRGHRAAGDNRRNQHG
jgi:hypothetical protein